jgi:hypothetical protein
MVQFDALKKLVADTEADVQKVDAGNKAAKTRVRKQMQAIKEAAQEIRVALLKDEPAPVQTPAN